MPWRTIAAADCVAYEAVSGTLFERFRQRTLHAKSTVLQGVVDTAFGYSVWASHADEGLWKDADTIRFYIPEWAKGDGGTRLVIRAKVSISAGSGVAQVSWRLHHGSYSSDVIYKAGAGTWDDQTLTLDFSPTTGAVADVAVQQKVETDIASPGVTPGWLWESSRCDAYLQSL